MAWLSLETLTQYFDAPTTLGEKCLAHQCILSLSPPREDEIYNYELPIPKVMSIDDSRLALLKYAERPQCMDDNINWDESKVVEQESGTSFQLSNDEARVLTNIITFLKTDKPPEVEWSNIHQLSDFLEGVEFDDNTADALINYNCLLGHIMRKNKIAFRIFKIPPNGVIQCSRQILRQLIKGAVAQRAPTLVRKQLILMQLFAAEHK